MTDTLIPDPSDMRSFLQALIEHFDHVLPGQAAIQEFVHHNTLHGYQQLPFPEALAAAEKVTGAYGYLPPEQFRAALKTGRISREDLEQVINDDPDIDADEVMLERNGEPLTRRDILIGVLRHSLSPVTGCQLTWQVEELNALNAFQPDVDDQGRERLLNAAKQHGQNNEAEAIADLWTACLHVLGLDHFALHPEDLLDMTPEQAEQMLSAVIDEEEHSGSDPLLMDRLIKREADRLMDSLFQRLGKDLTLAGLLQAVTGKDLMEDMRPVLIRHIGAFLDQGLAAWQPAERDQGFYSVWRAAATHDVAWVFDELPDWRDSIDALPEDPLDVVNIELKWLGLPEEQWAAYLERLALELPGWSGMFLWRHNRPGYEGLDDVKVDMTDYLAVRLVMERLFAQRLCRKLWVIESSFDVIRWYFRHNRAEFLVRYMVHNRHLPEYLVTLTERLLSCSTLCGIGPDQWLHLAHLIWTWLQSPASDRPRGYTVQHSAWRLFRMAQHLGICGADIRGLDRNTVAQLFSAIDSLDEQHAGFIWLQAYERHHREQVFNAIVSNHGRGRWSDRTTRPQAQVVFCMDDREEGFRRHLEEHNPAIETLGAAGFFGIPINWLGLDDSKTAPLCPVVVTPSHDVHEQVQPGHEPLKTRHDKRRRLRTCLKDIVHQETRRNLFRTSLLILLAAPATLLVLAGKVLAPLSVGRLSEGLRRKFDRTVPTTIGISTDDASPATPEQPRLGFTDEEQADRIHGFMRIMGLQDGFAPLVVMMGHGSSSQNNPHLAAYDCGACSGRHGGPNARAFAAMANRPEVRALLKTHGIEIPADTWFLGAEHDTCNEDITWYDEDVIPQALQADFAQLQQDLHVAVLGSAHERSRRLASAPKNPSPQRALRHMMGRARDFSQARPELGHATNAAAIIGRRSISQGAFFDRRLFMISYNPKQDPEGTVLEAILLAAGPVAAGISLEYYFSTVNNEQYGCGSKITHNVTGLFGVMEGTSSDLRTGLPNQMIEIHEAMRLQLVVEADVEVLTKIYQRQPPLQELVGNGWLLLSAKDPDSESIHVFKPGVGFVLWDGARPPLETVDRSPDWYKGHSGPIGPALIKQEVQHG